MNTIGCKQVKPHVNLAWPVAGHRGMGKHQPPTVASTRHFLQSYKSHTDLKWAFC